MASLMSERPEWDDQFAEDDDERRERFRKLRAKRTAEGKCWQCCRSFKYCACPNIRRADIKSGKVK